MALIFCVICVLFYPLSRSTFFINNAKNIREQLGLPPKCIFCQTDMTNLYSINTSAHRFLSMYILRRKSQDQGFWTKIMVMVSNATFSNISAISWLWGLLMEETGVPGENHRPVPRHWQTLSHIAISSTHHLSRIRTDNCCGDRHILPR
jgi:hypothetical protein